MFIAPLVIILGPYFINNSGGYYISLDSGFYIEDRGTIWEGNIRKHGLWWRNPLRL